MWSFRTRVARWTAHRSSEGPSCITTTTSPRSETAADAAQTPFITLSEEGRSAERCEPTKTTGTGVESMNASAAAEYAMVSVPCVTITPAAPSSIAPWTARASSCQRAGVMFSERMVASTCVRYRAISARPGMARRMSAAVNWLVTAPVR